MATSQGLLAKVENLKKWGEQIGGKQKVKHGPNCTGAWEMTRRYKANKLPITSLWMKRQELRITKMKLGEADLGTATLTLLFERFLHTSG